MNTCITSFNAGGYEKYGREFIKTFIQFWPKSVKLIVYYEGCFIVDQTADNIEWHPIDEIQALSRFMDKINPLIPKNKRRLKTGQSTKSPAKDRFSTPAHREIHLTPSR